MVKKNVIKWALASFFLLFVFSEESNSQNIQTSPMSRYGYGTLVDQSPTAYKGMGGVGVALRESNVVNFKNPASLSAIDSLSFVLDIGLTSELKKLNDDSYSKYTFQSNIDYIAFQLPIFKTIGVAAGITPFSRVGYNMANKQLIPSFEDVYFVQNFTGKGSFQNLFVSTGFHLFKGLSLGLKANYLFGKIEHSIVSLPTSSSINNRFEDISYRISSWSPTFGIQYEFKRNTNAFVLGTSFSPQISLPIKVSHTIDKNYGDALKPDISLEDPKLETAFPLSLSFGASYLYDNKLLAAGDVKLVKWGSVPNIYKSQDIELKDAYEVSLGVSYLKDKFSRKYRDRIIYKGGFNYSAPYFSHNKLGSASLITVALGMGLPIHVNDERTSYFNLSLEYSKNLQKGSLYVNENLLRLSLSINFNETWFRKLKIY